MADTEAEVSFKKETVSKLLTSFFKEEKSRLSSDAAVLMAELLKIFVQEAAVRSQKQAEAEDCEQVDIEHFKKILPQLLPYMEFNSPAHRRLESPVQRLKELCYLLDF